MPEWANLPVEVFLSYVEDEKGRILTLCIKTACETGLGSSRMISGVILLGVDNCSYVYGTV